MSCWSCWNSRNPTARRRWPHSYHGSAARGRSRTSAARTPRASSSKLPRGRASRHQPSRKCRPSGSGHGNQGRTGRGGMGTVYRGERDDGSFEQTVAVKLIRAELVSARTPPALRQRAPHPRFTRSSERGAAARCGHHGARHSLPGARVRRRANPSMPTAMRVASMSRSDSPCSAWSVPRYMRLTSD